MKQQILTGDEKQIRELVDWTRKKKIWEREHGWDDDFKGGGSQDE
jgi:hypothetical protein